MPVGYSDKIAASTVTGAAKKGVGSFWKVATQESTGFKTDNYEIKAINNATKMALAQLGSCKF